jgi:parallel beta-helix repeat protein
MLAPNATWGNTFVLSLERNFPSSDSPPAGPKVVLHQNFDNETIGVKPGNWSLKWSLNQTFGTFLVEKTDRGRSAKFVDNSTNSSPGAYRNFAEQKGTIAVSFAVRLVNNTGKNTGLEIRVDDGTSAGANIVFGNGTIQYIDQNGQPITLRCSYVANRWYRIKFIIDIVANVYNIHIDDHLEVINTKFTGPCDQIHRIVINETSTSVGTLLPIGDIDDIEVRKGIVIPTDFPTIQEGVNEADPGDTVFVKNRTYFENVRITKNLYLVGEDRNATIIDGHFTEADGLLSNIISVSCSNVTIYGFTIKNAKTNGVYVDCLNNTISNNIIINSLGCGIYLVGSNSTVTNNIIESNGECGIRIVEGKDNLVRGNIIKNNAVGLRCGGCTQDNLIYQNRFVCNSRQFLDYGSNKWDDGYPYKPKEQKGGGNYWSDFLSVDMYSGVNQDIHGPSSSPLPDGICDAPYGLDRYPLFLIQNVAQNPAPSLVTYDKDVKVNATMLTGVEVQEAKIYVHFDSNSLAKTMNKKSDYVWNGTIPRKPYGTQVRYYISARAYCAVWLNSTNYPLTAPYFVNDTTKPTIGIPNILPSSVNETHWLNISVVVTKPTNASGVDKVLLSYNFSVSVWKTQMIKNGDDRYWALVPKQPGGKPFNFLIEAFDKAGNKNNRTSSTDIKSLAELSLKYKTGTTSTTCNDPCNVDFGVMSKGEKATNTSYQIWNIGQSNLRWQIVAVKLNPWFTITPTNGTTGSGHNTSITITVNTADGLDPWPAVGEFSIKANGTKSEWTIIIRVTVRLIVIDDSWASSEAPNRCNVGSTQYYAFHAIWSHNSSYVTSGTITVKVLAGATKVGEKSGIPFNGTGWATFPYNLTVVGQRTFSVEGVNCPYVYAGKVYYIKSFAQEAHNLTTIWDRVKIILSIADDRIDVGSKANISNASVYEFDNSSLEGYPLFNDTLSHNTVGKWYITTSSVVDPKYHLTAFKSNTVWCIWDEIEIIGGGVSQSQLDAGQTGTVWFTAIYRYENKLFKGADGILYANNETLIWLSDTEVWVRNYTSATPGTKTFTVTGVEDTTHKLTEIKDNVGPLSITWGPKPWWPSWLTTNSDLAAQNQPSPVASYPWPALAIILAAAIGMVATILILMKPGKKRSQGGKGE